MLVPEGNLTTWASNWTTMLHQVSCNDTLLGCAEECDVGSNGFDYLCTVERTTFASTMTLFCTPCDYASCNVNVSLLLNGLDSIEGVFLSRIPTGGCNATSFEEEVSHSRIGPLKSRNPKESGVQDSLGLKFNLQESENRRVPKVRSSILRRYGNSTKSIEDSRN